MNGLAASVAVCLAGVASGCTSPPSSAEEQAAAIWELEELYVQRHLDADHAGIKELFDDSFLGWPNRLASPIGREEVETYLKTYYPQPLSRRFRVEPVGVRVVGDVAVAQFRLHVWPDADEAAAVNLGRFSHTWMRDGRGWKLLSVIDAPNASAASN